MSNFIHLSDMNQNRFEKSTLHKNQAEHCVYVLFISTRLKCIVENLTCKSVILLSIIDIVSTALYFKKSTFYITNESSFYSKNINERFPNTLILNLPVKREKI